MELPAAIHRVVEHWEHPLSPECPPELATPGALVHVARKLAEAEVAGIAAAEVAETIASEILETFHLDVELLDEVYASLPARMSMEQLQAGR
ncbi:MAG: hypothetical protein HY236_06700 [Acidobacteria bacterium]|nr:hypothetical protein [Acidobacteriota bacterium]